MTTEQEEHLSRMVKTAGILIEEKYRRGQVTHGGNLFDLSPSQLIDEAINEAIDQLVYLITARQGLEKFKNGAHLNDDSEVSGQLRL